MAYNDSHLVTGECKELDSRVICPCKISYNKQKAQFTATAFGIAEGVGLTAYEALGKLEEALWDYDVWNSENPEASTSNSVKSEKLVVPEKKPAEPVSLSAVAVELL